MNAIGNPGMPALKINGLGTVNVFSAGTLLQR